MRIRVIVMFILILVLPIQAFAAENVRKIVVDGKSEITLDAHYAVVQLRMKYVNKEMNQSHSELIKTISKLTETLTSIGLNDKDIKKSLILQGSEYSWKDNSEVFKGYYSECILEIHVNDISKIGSVYRTLANYKNITIQGTDYKRNDEFDIRKVEFEKALLAAKKKAEYMAQTLNVKIGKVYSIQELNSENFFVRERYSNISERVSGASTTNYGNIKISARVMVEFELE